MAGWKHFEEIAAWQHSRQVKLRIYALLERPTIMRDVKLSTQLRESARSAPSNIAEGFGRFGNKEFARFARMSKGSLHESLNHLIDAKDQRMISADELVMERHHIEKAINAVTGLIRHLETSKEPDRNQPRTRNPKPRTVTPNPNPNPNPNPEQNQTRNPEPVTRNQKNGRVRRRSATRPNDSPTGVELGELPLPAIASCR